MNGHSIHDSQPIPSMHGIFKCSYLICMETLGKCTIHTVHGSYGLIRVNIPVPILASKDIFFFQPIPPKQTFSQPLPCEVQQSYDDVEAIAKWRKH